VNSKVIGAMLILGPLLTVLPWFAFGTDTSEMTPSQTITTILAESGATEARAILNMFG
jgi:hypothetical protein